MRCLLLRSTLLGLLMAVAALPVSAAQADSASEVVAAEKARTTALEHNDFQALEKLLGEDLTYVHSSGFMDTKASFLAAIRSGELRYISWKVKVAHARVLGDTAVLNGEYAIRVINRHVQPDPLEMNIFFLSVYTRRDGQWQQIAWQSTRETPPSSASK